MILGSITAEWSTDMLYAVLEVLRRSDDPYVEAAIIMVETDIKIRSRERSRNGYQE